MPLLRTLRLSFVFALMLLPTLAHAEDAVALASAISLEVTPEWLPSARNVKIEIAPEPQAVLENKTEIAPAAPVDVTAIPPVPELPTSLENKVEIAPVAPIDATATSPTPEPTATPENTDEFVPAIEINNDTLTEQSPELPPAENPKTWWDQDTGTTENSLWPRIRNGFAMRDLDSPLIAKHAQWYAARPDYLARIVERAQRYLYFITSEVERRGMPSEIALLPMIESAFNPGALSTTRASGIWQFMPATGKSFGMKQSWWNDDRRDIINATNGALDYLQRLYNMFGDWELALAAYNWGEGSVQRAQARNRKAGLATNYSSLSMPAETRNYVPKLLAVKSIIANPESFGITLNDIPDQPYFAAVATTQHMDVKLAAQLADISLEEFMALNPEHNRPVIVQGKSTDVILLPVDKTETFRANLESYDKPLVSWQTYQPKKGERLDQLAPRFGLTVANLKSVNGLSARSNISTGQTLLVPLNGDEGDGEFDAFNMHIVPLDVRITSLKHKVRKGDTYTTIARRYHVSVTNLKRLNKSVKRLKIGQLITVAPADTSRKNVSRYRYAGKKRYGKVARQSVGKKVIRSGTTKKIVRSNAHKYKIAKKGP